MTIVTAIMIIASLVFIPLTVKLSKVIGKNITYAIGMIIIIISLLIMFLMI